MKVPNDRIVRGAWLAAALLGWTGVAPGYMVGPPLSLEKITAEPRDIYAFYLQRALTERAKKFREAARKAASYDLDYYFKRVDQNPSLYKRW